MRAVTPEIHGTCDARFARVRDEFARNFAERGEIGAAVAAYWRGEKVVDLWGGRRTPDGGAPGKQTRWLSSCPPRRAWRR